MLIDCGANVDCRPEYLHQFAQMGTAYMQTMRGVANPRVGLVNNGAEAEKGCALTKAAYEILSADEKLNFVGNVEAREITHDSADVIVCDGFVGNVILKFMEGVAGTLMGMIKREMLADTRSKIGALLAKPAFHRVKKAMDYSEVGGAPLLGVSGNVVKAHGSCNAHAFACASPGREDGHWRCGRQDRKTVGLYGSRRIDIDPICPYFSKEEQHNGI